MKLLNVSTNNKIHGEFVQNMSVAAQKSHQVVVVFINTSH